MMNILDDLVIVYMLDDQVFILPIDVLT